MKTPVLSLLLLLLLLCVRTTHQREVQVNKQDRPDTVAEPRTFKGAPVWIRTQAPASPPAPPALASLGNRTAGYLGGPLSTRVIPVVYLLAAAIGIPANVAILCSLASKVRKVSGAILYCSLALSDFFLLLSLLFRAQYHLSGNRWALGEAACCAVTACFYGNLYCSGQTLACISIKRYLAVAHPFRYKTLPKRALAAGVALVTWAASAAAALPELLVRQSYRLPELDRLTCHDVLPLDGDSHGFLLYYNLVVTALGLLAPLAVTAACYARIVRELERSHHDWAMYVKASSLSVATFLFCFTPAGVLRLLHYAHLSACGAEGLYEYFNMAVCLCCLHACLDPFLFLLMSKSVGSGRYPRVRGKNLSISV